jgi:hypothetical protein
MIHRAKMSEVVRQDSFVGAQHAAPNSAIAQQGQQRWLGMLFAILRKGASC